MSDERDYIVRVERIIKKTMDWSYSDLAILTSEAEPGRRHWGDRNPCHCGLYGYGLHPLTQKPLCLAHWLEVYEALAAPAPDESEEQ